MSRDVFLLNLSGETGVFFCLLLVALEVVRYPSYRQQRSSGGTDEAYALCIREGTFSLSRFEFSSFMILPKESTL